MERTIGVWKQGFRCLDQSAGYLMSKAGYVADIVVACGILHNIAIRQGHDLDIPEDGEYLNHYGEEAELDEHERNKGQRNQQLIRGLEARQRIVRDYFNRD